MRYITLLLPTLIAFSCTSNKPAGDSNEAVLTRLDSINSWYNKIVVKQYRPVYIFETAPYNNGQADVRGNVYQYYLIEQGQGVSQFDADFVARNFDFARSYLVKKHLSYSGVYLQIPVKTAGYNRDVVTLSADQEANVRKLTKDVFIFDNSIASLVDSKRYNPGFSWSQLPKELLKAMQDRFESIKSILPEKYRKYILNSRLIIDDPSISFDPEKLFLNNSQGNVHISSLLVRAVFVSAISREAMPILDYSGTDFKLDRPVQLMDIPLLQDERTQSLLAFNSILNPRQQSWESARQRFARFKKPEVEFAYNNILKTINSTFDFLMLHEFSHIYLQENGFDEYRCDCYAYKALKKQSPSINYGIFENMMVNALEKNQGRYWFSVVDSSGVQQIIDRFKKLKTLDSLVDKGLNVDDIQCGN